MKLQKVLSEKKETQRLYTIESGATLRTAAKKMISLKTDYLMVKAKDHTPAEFIGILTKVDIVRSLCMEKSNPDTDTVDDFMTRRMIVANVNDDVEYLMNVMVATTSAISRSSTEKTLRASSAATIFSPSSMSSAISNCNGSRTAPERLRNSPFTET